MKAPLAALDTSTLAPYEVVHRAVLEPTVVEQLGTEDYISWSLLDKSRPATDPLRDIQLHIAYYTGAHNLVPHVPDSCLLGSGYQAAQPHENETIEVPSLAPGETHVPIRVLSFAKTGVFSAPAVERCLHILLQWCVHGDWRCGARGGDGSVDHVRVLQQS